METSNNACTPPPRHLPVLWLPQLKMKQSLNSIFPPEWRKMEFISSIFGRGKNKMLRQGLEDTVADDCVSTRRGSWLGENCTGAQGTRVQWWPLRPAQSGFVHKAWRDLADHLAEPGGDPSPGGWTHPPRLPPHSSSFSAEGAASEGSFLFPFLVFGPHLAECRDQAWSGRVARAFPAGLSLWPLPR